MEHGKHGDAEQLERNLGYSSFNLKVLKATAAAKIVVRVRNIALAQAEAERRKKVYVKAGPEGDAGQADQAAVQGAPGGEVSVVNYDDFITS